MKHRKLHLSPKLILLDAVGTILIIIGALEWFNQIGIVPEPLRFAHFEFVLVAVGIFCMMPIITHFALYFKQQIQEML